MFHTRVLLKVLPLVFLMAVAMTLVAAPASNNQPAANPGDVIHLSLQPDLTVKMTLSPALLPQLLTASSLTGLRTCRCSCGFPCETNADCGPGGVCAAGITCCNKDPQSDLEFQRGLGFSSRLGEMPVQNVKCK